MERTKRDLTRRRFLGGMGATGLALGLAACGASPASTSGSGGHALTHSAASDLPSWLKAEARQYKGRTLNVIASQQYFDTTNSDFVKACQTFGQLTGNTINVSVLNVDTGNMVTREDAAVKAGNPPDTAFVDASRFPAEWQQLGDLQPVTDVVNELTGRYGAPMPVNELYLKSSGEWWAVPFFSLVNGAFARKDWLEAKGIKTGQFVTSPRTFTEMRDICLEISDPTQQRYGWGITYNNSGDGNGFILTVLNAYGASVASNDGKTVTFGKGPETEEAVSFIAETYTSSKYAKMLPPGVESWGDISNNQAWLAGTIGFTFNAFSLYAQSKSEGNPVYDKTLLFGGLIGPAIKQVIDIGTSEAFVVFKHAKEPGLAKLLAKYVCYGNTLLSMVKDSVGLVLPAYENIWASNPYYLKGDPAFKGEHQVLVEPLPIKSSTGFSFPQTPSPGAEAVNTAYVLSDMIGSIVKGQASVSQGVATARHRIVQIFEQQGLPQS